MPAGLRVKVGAWAARPEAIPESTSASTMNATTQMHT